MKIVGKKKHEIKQFMKRRSKQASGKNYIHLSSTLEIAKEKKHQNIKTISR